MSWKKTAATGASAAAVVAAAVVFTPSWEGMDKVARRDAVGTGHPITYCYGQTDEFGRVAVGTRFNKQQCDEKLAQSLPKYLSQIDPCVHVPVPVKTMSSLVDAAYNAGPSRVCHSPMVARINAGNIRAGCEAFKGWIITGDHHVLPGLIARRSGRPGDARKSERDLCIEGLSDPKSDWYTPSGVNVVASPPAEPARRHATPKRQAPKPPEHCAWWRKCS